MTAESRATKSSEPQVQVDVLQGFRVMHLKAVDGAAHSGTEPPEPKPFVPNAPKPVNKNLPGVHDNRLIDESDDGGKVTFDKAGNIIEWQSKDKASSRKFIYHDMTADRVALQGRSAEPIFQDKNGTYFQFLTDSKGHKYAEPKLFTKAYGINEYADFRGPGDSTALFNRGLTTNGSPRFYKFELTKHLTLNQTLDEVDDNHGHVWKRSNTTGQLHEFTKDGSGKLVDDHKDLKDKELIPQDSFVIANKNVLFNDATHPETSIKPAAVQQTELGDCYFESPVSAVAGDSPKTLTNMIVDNHDGTFTVKFPLSDPTFHGLKGGGTKGARDFLQRPTLDVRVEAPTEAEVSTFNEPFSKTRDLGYWSSVLEKAHRYLVGKVTEDNGNDAPHTVQMITGVRKFIDFYKHDENSNNQAFNKQVDSSEPAQYQTNIVASDWDSQVKTALTHREPVLARTGDKSNQWVVAEDDPKKPQYALPENHIYSIVAYENPKGSEEAKLIVRNPWGHALGLDSKNYFRPYDDKDNGLFEITVGDFNKLFASVYINPTNETLLISNK